MGGKQMNNDLRELAADIASDNIYHDTDIDVVGVTNEGIDELITLIRTATLDEAEKLAKNLKPRSPDDMWNEGYMIAIMEYEEAIDNLRGSDE